MNYLIKRANKRISLGNAAALISVASLLGAVLGIVRTRLISKYFPGAESAAYFAAFEIPDFIFFTLASGALGVAFLPVLSDRLESGNKKSAWELSSSLLNLIAIVSLCASIVMIIFARQLLGIFHLTPATMDKAVNIMRLVSLNPLIFTISSVMTTMQQAFGRFFFFAIAPLFYNVSIIASLFIFRGKLGIVGIGFGVLVGSFLQLIVSFAGMLHMGFKYRPQINFKNPYFWQVLKAIPARSIDQGIDYINSITETRFASALGEKFISLYKYAFILHTVPINLIGIAISTAAFPRFTERISQGRPDLFRKEFLQVLRAMIWISLPVVVISYFARAHLVRLIFFNTDVREVATIFGFLTTAIFFRTVYSIISRYFYAQKDTKTPLFVSLFAIALNIFLAYNLSKQDRYGVEGLAIAQSFVAAAEVLVLLFVMVIKDKKLFTKDFWQGILKIVSVTGFSVVVAFLSTMALPLTTSDKVPTIIFKLILIGFSTITVHIILSSLYGLEEARPIIDKAKQIIFKPVKL